MENKYNYMIIPDSNDFLEDLSNLSDDLKHPNNSKIDTIDIDTLIEDAPMEVAAESESLPVKKESQLPTPTQEPVSSENDDPKDIQNYILQQCQDIIKQGKDTLEQLQDTVINTCDGKAINGYATLVASLSKVLDTANSIGMEKSRIKSSIELENLKHQHKTQMKSSDSPVTQNTVNIVAGREEVMKMLKNMAEEQTKS